MTHIINLIYFIFKKNNKETCWIHQRVDSLKHSTLFFLFAIINMKKKINSIGLKSSLKHEIYFLVSDKRKQFVRILTK